MRIRIGERFGIFLCSSNESTWGGNSLVALAGNWPTSSAKPRCEAKMPRKATEKQIARTRAVRVKPVPQLRNTLAARESFRKHGAPTEFSLWRSYLI